MREFRPYGSVRGALSNGRPYRDTYGKRRLSYWSLCDTPIRRLPFLQAGLGTAEGVHVLTSRPQASATRH